PSMGLRHERVQATAEAGGVVVVAEHRRDVVERPGGAVAPGLGEHVTVTGPGCDAQGRRPVRRTDAAPHLVGVHPERRVTPTVALLAEDAEGRTRPGRAG